jgi:D-beta-D-heptose 7-phosphate kinase/D-beta-D-heptose 1-phosphate adenosyltransferase
MSKIYVIGDLILDEYWDGDIFRMSQEAPVPIYKKNKNDSYKLGGAGNVALNVKALGEAVVLVSPISKDSGGEALKELLEENNIVFLEQGNNSETIRKIRVQTSQQQIIRIDNDYEQTPINKQFYNSLLSIVEKNDVVIVSDYGKGSIDGNLVSFIRELKNFGIKNIIDPKGVNVDIYRDAFLIKPNLIELKKFSDKANFSNAAMIQIKEAYKFSNILLTLGAEGMILLEKDLSITRIDAIESPIFDATGVGDNISAAIAVALLRGYSLAQSCQYANIVASLAIMHKGCHAVNLNELCSVHDRLSIIGVVK